jgi:hypothetical protein
MELGEISVDVEKILINGKLLKWNNIVDISMTLHDYKGNFVWKGKWNFSNNLSAGIRNEVVIKISEAEIIKGNLLFHSRENLEKMKLILWSAIESNNLPFRLGKQLINPKSYDEYQKLKKFCS